MKAIELRRVITGLGSRSSAFATRRVLELLALALCFLATACTDCTDPKNHDKCADSVLWTASMPATGGSSGSADTTGSDSGTAQGGAGVTTPVVSSGFESGSSESGWSYGTWQVDNALGAHDGKIALHPPMLQAGDTATATFDCDAATHSELSFWYEQVTETGAPTAQALVVLVDGMPYTTIGGLLGCNGCFPTWFHAIIDVPSGTHSYRFTARSSVNISPPFVLDSFECTNPTAVPGHNRRVDFDEGYIPLEVGGTWQVDNLVSLNNNGDGEPAQAAAHPPAFQAGDSATMTFDCGNATHTELSFWYEQVAENGPPSAQALDVLVDGMPYTTIGGLLGCNGCFPTWSHAIIDVPSGTHSYAFTARSSTSIGPAFVLDSFQCTDTTPMPGHNGHVDFDDGFIPVEVSGAWQIDNLVSLQNSNDGKTEQAAAHPPPLQAGDSSTMTFDCAGVAHAELSFWYIQVSESSDPSAQTLAVLVDGKPQAKIGGLLGCNGCFPTWTQSIVEVPSGQHQYTFTAQSSVDIGPPFVVDSFVCQ